MLDIAWPCQASPPTRPQRRKSATRGRSHRPRDPSARAVTMQKSGGIVAEVNAYGQSKIRHCDSRHENKYGLTRTKPSVVDALLLTIRPISIAEAVRKRHGQITLVHPGNVSGHSELWFPVESEGQTRCVASLAGDWAHWDLRSVVLRQIRPSPKRRGSIMAGRAHMLRSLSRAPWRVMSERVLAVGAGRR